MQGLRQKYKSYLKSGKNPIRAMGLAMEEVKAEDTLKATKEIEDSREESMQTQNTTLCKHRIQL